MVDFTASIAAGLDAHQEHIKNRTEIAEVISQLSEQMLSATSGKVGAKVDTVEVELDEMLSLNFLGEGAALVAFSAEYPEVTRRLTLIKVPTSGYPVLLKWGREKITCSDRDGLVDALSRLLSLAFVGRIITELAEYTPGGGDY